MVVLLMHDTLLKHRIRSALAAKINISSLNITSTAYSKVGARREYKRKYICSISLTI